MRRPRPSVRLAVGVLRGAALLSVVALFAALVYRIAAGNPGAGLIRAVRAQRAPAVPDARFNVIWPHSETWPANLRASAEQGTLSLSALRGYPVVLNFWASWCTPCEREADLLASAAKAERGRVVFLAVDVHDFSSDARRFLGRHRVPFVAVRSGNSISERFGLVGLPETFYVDRRGRIRGMTRGQLSAAALRRQIERAARA
jgi:cytochrome c biogenesis protein CcmG, thiol:disulfide interchange protein DsbE